MLNNAADTPVLDASVAPNLVRLERHILSRRQAIEAWFKEEWSRILPPVYGSVDLRNAGFKLAPIDMNLFPAGFNNLNPDFLSIAVKAAFNTISRLAPEATRLLVIAESHTRNLNYWENIKTLETILTQAGFEVRLSVLAKEITEKTAITLPSGNVITLAPLERTEDTLHVGEFTPDAILLNNDLSDGSPAILENVEQPLIPPAELGWHQRLKSNHFRYYAEVANKFAEVAQIDPWEIAPLFRYCGKIDFMNRDGMSCLIENAETLFTDIKAKYAQYHIAHKPFLVIKADAGTYGMAVMTVRNMDELRSLNRKQRTRMATTKGGQTVSRVIIQEGVHTFETVGDTKAVAEPVVYLWGECVVGGFYRVHDERDVDENLNSPGMHFKPMAFCQPCDNPCDKSEPDASQNRFYVYGIIAKLSMLAAAREIADAKVGILA